MEIVNVSFGGGLSMQLTPVVVGLLSTTPSTILEGETINLTFITNTPGSSYPYTISGVTSADIGGASLTGTFTANGETRTYNLTNDFVTEGNETFLMTLDNGQAGAAFTILDRYFTLTSNVASPPETGANSFTISLVTPNSFPVPYTISGNVLNAADFVTGNLTGNFTSNGQSLLFTLAADALSEGNETLKLTLDQWPNANIEIVLNDTSNTGSQVEFTVPGTYSWIAPVGVTSVSAVAVGAGGAGGISCGGGGGALSWSNATVIPGTIYTIVVGNGGKSNTSVGASGGFSSFGSNIVYAGGGWGAGVRSGFGIGGNVRIGAGGGNGGTSTAGHGGGGGGAGGYTGNGGDHSPFSGTNGSGGGGGGGASSRYTGTGGGGVGIYGQGPSGLGGVGDYLSSLSEPTGGSGGLPLTQTTYGFGPRPGNVAGRYGGGGYGSGGPGATGNNTGWGANGAVRVIWGTNRYYPVTNTANV